jgi:hypothetical protein
MNLPQSYRGSAYNPVPESENRIHSDEIAHRFGFRGGLVPGVVISAYLLQPAIEAWGGDWLSRGGAKVVVAHPLYDDEDFDVVVEGASGHGYSAQLLGTAGDPRARATVTLPDVAPEAPQFRGDRRITAGQERATASRASLERLREEGLGAVRVRWPEAEITSYTKDSADMPRLLRLDAEGYANPAFVLGMSNWAFAANVRMSAWLHLQTEHQNHAAIPIGSELVVEQRISDLFEKKGHEFVDVELAAFFVGGYVGGYVGAHVDGNLGGLHDGQPVMSARLRAIYRLRDEQG